MLRQILLSIKSSKYPQDLRDFLKKRTGAISADTTKRLRTFTLYAARLNLSLLLCSIIVWSITKPVYITILVLSLPGNVTKSSTSLPGVGATTQMTGSSGFGSSMYDPRSNYKYLFLNPKVISRASDVINIQPNTFEKPKIENISNSTLIKITFKDDNASLSYKKANAFLVAISEYLDDLRKSELSERTSYIQKALDESRERLQASQEKLMQYKLNNKIDYAGQPLELSKRVDNLLVKRVEIVALKSKIQNKYLQLSSDLNLAPSQAAQAFILRGDSVFQELLASYSDDKAKLDVESAKFGVNHPKARSLSLTIEKAYSALKSRANAVLGTAIESVLLQKIALSKDKSGLDSLYQQLIVLHSDLAGSASQINRLDKEIMMIQDLIRKKTLVQPELQSLTRDVQVSEAFFTSLTSQINLVNSDIYSAYPQIQLVVQPALPAKDSSNKTLLICIGTFLSSVLLTSGLFMVIVLKRGVFRAS